MSAPNLHVALAMALGRQPSDSDAALIQAVYRLRGRSERETRDEREGAPVQLEIGEVA